MLLNGVVYYCYASFDTPPAGGGDAAATCPPLATERGEFEVTALGHTWRVMPTPAVAPPAAPPAAAES